MVQIQQFTTQITEIFLLGFLGFLLAMLLTPVYTFFAYKYGFWKKRRTTATTGELLTIANTLHLEKHKRRIPTMAGVIMIVAATAVTLIFNNDRQQTWLPLAALLGGGLVGLMDDIINVRGDGTGVSGLRSPIKFGLITAVAAIAAWFFYSKLGIDYHSVHIPFVAQDLYVGWLIIPLFIAVVVSTGNAVNISDGLDGLAGGLLATSFGVFGMIAILQGNFGIAGFCFTMVGTLLAYVWFNIFPARFFMGDTGSFAFGTALGVVAMLTNTLFLLPIIGLIFVIEAGSSVIQIFSKKVFKRRVFISAPFHRHLEVLGWPETKVTMRFWVIGQVMAALGLLLAIAGGHIG